MSTPEYTWQYHLCEICGDFATHELWWGNELLHRYCTPCSNEKAAETDRFWREIGEAAAGEEESAELA